MDHSAGADRAESTSRAYSEAEAAIAGIYDRKEGSLAVEQYFADHEINSMLILTVSSWYAAQAEVQKLIPDITGKTVVEIGAGVGMLALQMARYAKYVWAIEADPSWSWVFTEHLYRLKPPNLTWIFGRAQDLIGSLYADVAVIYTRSDLKGMGAIGAAMASRVVRGPRVEYSERYGGQMTAAQLKLAEEMATEAMLKVGSRRGMDGATLRDLEKRFMERCR